MSEKKTFKIRRDPTLFLETRKYHNRAMKRLFLKYYEPLMNGKRNKHWTIHVNKSDMYDLRVHFSWVYGMNVFRMTEQYVGIKILKHYKKTGELPFLNHLIRNKKWNK